MRISITLGRHHSATQIGQFERKQNVLLSRAQRQADKLERYKVLIHNLKGKDKKTVRDTMPRILAGMFQELLCLKISIVTLVEMICDESEDIADAEVNLEELLDICDEAAEFMDNAVMAFDEREMSRVYEI